MQSLDSMIEEVDSLVVASALALASLTPGPAGQAAAVAAMAYDTKRKRWTGVALSAASMIPLAGYVPALFKVGMLIVQLDRRLKVLEARELEFHDSPESFAALVDCLGKYYRKLPNIWLTRPLRARLERIMSLVKPPQVFPLAPSDKPSEATSISTQIP
jgi:hypothetical protein